MSTGYEAQFAPAMRLALAEQPAQAADRRAGRRADPGPRRIPGGGRPVGAVVLDPAGAVIGRAAKRREADGDPTAHAELLAIRAAARHRASGG